MPAIRADSRPCTRTQASKSQKRSGCTSSVRDCVPATGSAPSTSSRASSVSAARRCESVTLCELLETRMLLEVPLAGLAAERSDEASIGALVEAIDDARGRDPAGDEFRLADARFHRTIAVMAGNDLLLTFTSWILDV